MLLQVESIPRNMKNAVENRIEGNRNINASNIASARKAKFAERALRSNP